MSDYLKSHSDFSKDFFLNFRSYLIEKQGFINLSNKSYASVILSDYEVTFIGKGKDATFYWFICCVFLIDCIT